METQEKKEFEQVNMLGIGMPNTGFARYLTGNSYLDPLTKPGKSSVFLANVTFEPGCRSNRHIHHAGESDGQILMCTTGSGRYQEEGEDAASLEPGTVITIPAEIKYWHGAKADSWFSHIAVGMPGTNTGNEWCEPITDREYERLPQNMFLERKDDLYEFICL